MSDGISAVENPIFTACLHCQNPYPSLISTFDPRWRTTYLENQIRGGEFLSLLTFLHWIMDKSFLFPLFKEKLYNTHMCCIVRMDSYVWSKKETFFSHSTQLCYESRWDKGGVIAKSNINVCSSAPYLENQIRGCEFLSLDFFTPG